MKAASWEIQLAAVMAGLKAYLLAVCWVEKLGWWASLSVEQLEIGKEQ
jgi:hypothetical protein